MSLSMYEATVPVCIRMLSSLDQILVKAAEHADQHDIDPSVLINARLFPDMFALVRQVQIACDIANRGVARLAGMDPVSMADEETSFEQLRERISRTLEILEAVPRDAIDGSEQRSIRFPLRGHEMQFEGQDYLFQFVLPNVFFHVTTAYNILRHNGVVLGKRDFLGEF